MALPAEFNTVTVVMDYVDLTGAAPPAGSRVEFSPPSDTFLKGATSKVTIYPGTITANLTAGHGSVVLPYTNDPDITPTFPLQVTERLGQIPRTYTVEIPVGLGAGPINLADLAPIGVTVVGTNYLTRGVADGLYASLDAEGRVLDGNGDPVEGGGLDEAALTAYLLLHPPTADTIVETSTAKVLTASERTAIAGAQSASQVDTRADARITAWVGAAPAAFNTLTEIAAELAADDTAAAALVTTVAAKAAAVNVDARYVVVTYDTAAQWGTLPTLGAGQHYHFVSELNDEAETPDMTDGDKWTPHVDSPIWDTFE
jgi:hypothetical protein